jgi:hypothetical protein
MPTSTQWKGNFMNGFMRFSIIAALALLAVENASQTRGANLTWNVSSGTWSTPGNWNPSGPPGAADTATIVNGGTAMIPSGGTAACITLTLGGTNSGTVQLLSGGSFANGGGGEIVGQTGNGTFNQSGGTNTSTGFLVVGNLVGGSGTYSLGGGSLTTSGNLTVGNSGIGTFLQSGGTNTVTSLNDLVLGFTAAGSGSYTLSSSGYLAATLEYVGYSGSGAFSQSGGTNSIASSGLEVGYNSGVGGSYTLSGSGYVTAPTEYVGYSGSGTFTQTGGTNSLSASLFLGTSASANGTYNLSSGSLAALTEYVGYNGTATFSQSGGVNTVSGTMFLGNSVGGSGTYSLSGGSLATSGNLNVGYAGSGSFVQSGGTVSVAGANLNLGVTPSSSGAYNLSAGSLWLAGAITVGDNGNGRFTQTGGAISTPTVFVGFNNSGSYTLSGGSLQATGNELVGDNSFGSFSQSGGNHVVSGQLFIGSSPGISGNYTLSGSGSLNAASEYVGSGGSATFSQFGGNHTVSTELDVGYFNGSSGTYSLSGGSLGVSGNLNVGNSGSGNFNQTGGMNTVSGTGSLILGNFAGSGGTYSLGGNGMLTAPNEYVGGAPAGGSGNGTFTQNGGTNSVTGSLYVTASNSYTLNGGLLTAANEFVGFNGTSVFNGFNQTGGTNSVTGNLSISCAYNLYGGLLTGGTVTDVPGSGLGQAGGTFGPGTFVNTGIFVYQGGVFNGRLVTSGTFIPYINTSGGTQAISFYAGQGIENDGTLTVPAGVAYGTNGGSFTLDNEGTFILNGGSLAGGAAAGSGGPIVNNGLISGYGALSSGVGIINNSQISPIGGILTISTGTSNMGNAGTITLVSGGPLHLTSGTLLNTGNIYLSSSTVGGSGLVDNTTGVVTGPGTITAPFQNSGEINLPAGATNITPPFTNSGLIVLGGAGASITGGSIANTGSIQGAGAVSSQVNNAATGTIESMNGTLTFFGSLANSAGGLLTADAGSKLLVSSGLAVNLGTINLTGGIFDNNSFALSNSAEVSGYGTVRTGGLINYHTVTLTGAASTVNGPVTNASGGSISVSYNPAIFTGAAVNNGFIKTTATTVTWAGGFTNNATYLSDPAANYFSSLANNSTGLVQGGNGDSFIVTGAVSNAGQIDLGGTSTMVVGNGTGVLSQSAGTLEMGTGATLSAGSVEISGGILLADGPAASITADLIYDSASPSTYQGILAGTTNSLTVNGPGALLVLTGSNTYAAGTNVVAGTLIVKSPAAVRDGTSLTVGAAAVAIFAPTVPSGQAAASDSPASPVPEPGALALLASAAVIVLFRSRRRLI